MTTHVQSSLVGWTLLMIHVVYLLSAIHGIHGDSMQYNRDPARMAEN